MKGELVNFSNKILKNSFEKDTFLHANLFSRFFIVLSGPLANLLLGLLLITSLYVFHGRYITPPIINEIIDDKPAMRAGLLSDDKIISINKKEIRDFIDIKKIVENNPNNSLSFDILRNDNVITITVIPSKFYDEKLNKVVGRIGVTAVEPQFKTLSILSAIGAISFCANL